MARLVGLPDTLEQLVMDWERGPNCRVQRLGQYTWNNYGQRNIDITGNNRWDGLFYANHQQALELLRAFYTLDSSPGY